LSGTGSFSPEARAESIHRIDHEGFDVLVVGGGVMGCGITREATLRNYKTALVSKGDFASEANGHSFGLVRSGFDRLRRYGLRVGLRALREGRTLSSLAGHLFSPRSLLLVSQREDDLHSRAHRLGLLLCDLLSGSPASLRALGDGELGEAEPLLRLEGAERALLRHGYVVDGDRLSLSNARWAYAHGAAVANYVALVGFIKDGGRIVGAHLRDALTGERFGCRAKVMVNAAGQDWDDVRLLDDPSTSRRLRFTNASNLIVKRDRLPLSHTIVIEPKGGRSVATVPLGNCVAVGQADTGHVEDHGSTHASAPDVAHLLEVVNRHFPSSSLAMEDVLVSYPSSRPEMVGRSRKPRVATDHAILLSPSGLFSVVCGELLTYRATAEELMDMVSDVLHYGHGMRVSFLSGSSFEPLEGSFDEELRKSMLADMTKRGLEAGVADHLLSLYGSRYEEVLSISEADHQLRERMKPGLPHIWAEVPYSVTHECAVTLEDVMVRRLHLFVEDAEQGLDVASRVVETMAPLLGWDEGMKALQLSLYRRLVAESRP